MEVSYARPDTRRWVPQAPDRNVTFLSAVTPEPGSPSPALSPFLVKPKASWAVVSGGSAREGWDLGPDSTRTSLDTLGSPC